MTARAPRKARREGTGPEDPIGIRKARALEEALDIRARAGTPYLRLEIRNPEHGTRYWVFLPASPSREGAFCSCNDFARNGLGTCKHLEAAGFWLSENGPEAAPQPLAFDGRRLWRAIDGRVRRIPEDASAPALRARRPGELLSEPRPAGP